MSLILSLQIKLRKEKRLSWMMRTLGSRHSISCLEASRCCLHLGQYLREECARYWHGESLSPCSPAQPQGPHMQGWQRLCGRAQPLLPRAGQHSPAEHQLSSLLA